MNNTIYLFGKDILGYNDNQNNYIEILSAIL